MENWYAVQVRTGREEITAQLCTKLVEKDVIIECFIPKCERMKRYLGEWHIEQHAMFPGYIFIITKQIEMLFLELKKIPELTKILGSGTEFIPLKDSEEELLLHIGGEEHLAKMSQGYIVGDKVIITSGPMKDMGGYIKYINRHKRLAVVRVNMFAGDHDVTMSLEIVKIE